MQSWRKHAFYRKKALNGVETLAEFSHLFGLKHLWVNRGPEKKSSAAHALDPVAMAHFTSLKRTDDETKQQVQATRARNVVREGPKWYGAEHKKKSFVGPRLLRFQKEHMPQACI